MNTLESAWAAFMQAIDEARGLHARGADIGELLRHARELLDIIDEEVTAQSIEMSGAALRSLTHLRRRLESLEKDVMPARH